MMGKRKDARPPLTDGQLRKLKASDLVRTKLTPDETIRLRKINDARREEAADMTTRLREEERLVVTALRSVGVNVESVWDLVNTSTPYPKAIPILLKHLRMPYTDRMREGIARSLAVPDPQVRQAWATLVNEYRNAPIESGPAAPGETEKHRFGAKDGLACALSVAVTDETLPELIEMAKDRTQGESRLLLLSALRKRAARSTVAKCALDQLADDPDLAKEIASWGRGSEIHASAKTR